MPISAFWSRASSATAFDSAEKTTVSRIAASREGKEPTSGAVEPRPAQPGDAEHDQRLHDG